MRRAVAPRGFGGDLLASGSSGRTARLWSVESGTLLRTLAVNEGGVLSVAFPPARDYLASGGSDGTARSWPLRRFPLGR